MKDPEDLEQFLAAPEDLIGNEAQRGKYQRRKARQKAEEERLRAWKSDEEPSVEDLLADIVRVAEDPETNPMGWRFKQISRKRYREFGHFPSEFVDRTFGTFHHALEVAGLRDKPGTRRQKAARAAASRREHVRRYQERWLVPHVRQPRVFEGTQVVLSISDTHATYLDPQVWLAFLRSIQVLEPDVVVLNGDILEGSAISRHSKTGREIPLQVEFDFARTMLAQVRGLAPDAEVIWVAGNHGLDRMAAYLAQVAPGLAGLRSLRFDQLADLEGLGVTLAQGGSLVSPEGQEHDPPGLVLGDYRIHHGTKLGQTPAMAELKAAGRSGQSGHVHRASVAYGTTEADEGLSWMSTPMGCTDEAGRAYMKGTTTGWQRGFGIAYLHADGGVNQHPLVLQGNQVVVEGLLLELPEFDRMPWNENWLEGFPTP